MFYCKSCGDAKGWPTQMPLPQSEGACEVCDADALCFDVYRPVSIHIGDVASVGVDANWDDVAAELCDKYPSCAYAIAATPRGIEITTGHLTEKRADLILEVLSSSCTATAAVPDFTPWTVKVSGFPVPGLLTLDVRTHRDATPEQLRSPSPPPLETILTIVSGHIPGLEKVCRDGETVTVTMEPDGEPGTYLLIAKVLSTQFHKATKLQQTTFVGGEIAGSTGAFAA